MTRSLDHPVIGFRAWGVTNDGTLRSTYQDYVWQPGVQTAICRSKPFRNHPHQSPDGLFHHADIVTEGVPSHLCTCGIYADHTYGLAKAYFRRSAITRSRSLVYGIIKGWGTVNIHPDGWRSQYAEIKAIIDNGALAHKAAKQYDVPLINANADVELAASEFGKPVPEEHRPEQAPGDYSSARGMINQPTPSATKTLAFATGGLLLAQLWRKSGPVLVTHV